MRYIIYTTFRKNDTRKFIHIYNFDIVYRKEKKQITRTCGAAVFQAGTRTHTLPVGRNGSVWNQDYGINLFI